MYPSISQESNGGLYTQQSNFNLVKYPQRTEVAGCILLLLKLFLDLLSTYTDLPHLLFLNQSFSCFLQLVSSISFSGGLVYVFHPLHVPSSKHLPKVVSKHDHTT